MVLPAADRGHDALSLENLEGRWAHVQAESQRCFYFNHRVCKGDTLLNSVGCDSVFHSASGQLLMNLLATDFFFFFF